MRPLLQRVWRAAEETNSVETVTAVWRSLLGEDYAEAEHLLRPMGNSPTFPCPSPSSRLCPRRVVERRGKLLAVCNDIPRTCEPVVVSPPDIVLREVRMEEMAAIAARTLGIEPEVSTSRPDGEIWKLGTLSRRPGADLPAFFYSGRHSTRFDRAVGVLLRENPGPFLFVAARALISASPEVPSLRRRKCTVVTAEDVWFAADGGERIALEFPDERPRSRVAEAPADYAVQLPEFRREGKRWRLAFEGSAATVKHSVGMGHIHALLSAPRQPIAASKLAGVGGSEEVSWSGLPEERIDARAKAEYKRRIVAIDDQIEDAREAGTTRRSPASRTSATPSWPRSAPPPGSAGRSGPNPGWSSVPVRRFRWRSREPSARSRRSTPRSGGTCVRRSASGPQRPTSPRAPSTGASNLAPHHPLKSEPPAP